METSFTAFGCCFMSFMMLGVGDIQSFCHHLKIKEEAVTKTMKARKKCTKLWSLGTSSSLCISPASAHLWTSYPEISHMSSLFKSFSARYYVIAMDTLIYTFPFLARYFLVKLVQNFEATGYCSDHCGTTWVPLSLF